MSGAPLPFLSLYPLPPNFTLPFLIVLLSHIHFMLHPIDPCVLSSVSITHSTLFTTHPFFRLPTLAIPHNILRFPLRLWCKQQLHHRSVPKPRRCSRIRVLPQLCWTKRHNSAWWEPVLYPFPLSILPPLSSSPLYILFHPLSPFSHSPPHTRAVHPPSALLSHPCTPSALLDKTSQSSLIGACFVSFPLFVLPLPSLHLSLHSISPSFAVLSHSTLHTLAVTPSGRLWHPCSPMGKTSVDGREREEIFPSPLLPLSILFYPLHALLPSPSSFFAYSTLILPYFDLV